MTKAIFFWSKFSTKKEKLEEEGIKIKGVFTEQGVAMLATILKTKVAIKTSTKISYIYKNEKVYN